jgi:hypothetical protein
MTHPAADPDALRAIVRETMLEVLLEMRPGNGPPGNGRVPVATAPLEPRPVDAPAPARPADALRIERGALTEKLVIAAARDGRRVLLGRQAVATPLALDKARTLGVDVERTD